ncbi:hypothetical protein KKC45_04165 [Patescibacteria group bacterium]|nr:hypothetical protein [Patescibacteria group bacterium]
MTKTQLLKKEFLKLKKEIENLIEDIDTSKNSHLQNYFYFISYPLFSVTESVIILCENKKTNSAEVLLRSLIEAHINIIYHQLDDSEYRLAVSAKKGFDTKIKNTKGLKDFVRRYPNLKSEDPSNLFSDEWLSKAEGWAEVKRKTILRCNNLQKNDMDLDLRSKAIKCDKKYIDNIEKGHFERMYHIIYRQLSPTAHLNIEGIQSFVDENEKGEYSFSDRGNGEVLSAQAIEVCTAFTKDLYEHGVLKGKITSTVSKIESILKEENK